MKLTAYVIAAAVILPQSLNAQQAPETIRVSHADLDLRTRAGVELLDRRIAAAAKAVCPDTGGILEFARLAMARRCAAQAEEGARSQRDRIVSASAGLELAKRDR